MQECRDAETQGFRDTGMQGCRDAEMQRCRDAEMQGCRDASCKPPGSRRGRGCCLAGSLCREAEGLALGFGNRPVPPPGPRPRVRPPPRPAASRKRGAGRPLPGESGTAGSGATGFRAGGGFPLSSAAPKPLAPRPTAPLRQKGGQGGRTPLPSTGSPLALSSRSPLVPEDALTSAPPRVCCSTGVGCSSLPWSGSFSPQGKEEKRVCAPRLFLKGSFQAVAPSERCFAACLG